MSIPLRHRPVALVGAGCLLLAACGGTPDESGRDQLPDGFGIQLSEDQLASMAETIDDPEVLAAFGLESEPEPAAPPANLAFSSAPVEPSTPTVPSPAPTTEADATPEPTAEPTPEPVAVAPTVPSQRWWQWAAGQTWIDSPLTDPTGVDSARDQPGDVWFLAPYLRGQADRSCTVPAGIEIVVPLLARWCSPPLDDGCSFTNPEGAVVLDGESLDLIRVVNAEPYNIVGVAENPVTPGAGSVEAVDAGWWARIEGLAAGTYELVVWAESDEFDTAVRYELEVVEPTEPGR